MGNHRHLTADSQNERRRSANLARANAPAHRKPLAHLPDRKTHAVELQGLNGLSFALTENPIEDDLKNNYEEFFIQAFSKTHNETELEFEPYLKYVCDCYQNLRKGDR